MSNWFKNELKCDIILMDKDQITSSIDPIK